ncbi:MULTISPECIES: histidine kinase [Bacillales]|uniref:histidine kinase n=1 Tax=Bacillales TaxID=1385 RepID=UPI00203CD778|nr:MULTISPECIES: histidine kinase [Bacillales]MCM3638555.1 histidine kinase [Sporosarcina luteola]MCM3710508.1 histidine kinase [Sporosarcina luteola]
MRIFKFSIPIALLVAGISWWMLHKNFQEVPGTSRVWITVGAAILSGIIAHFLFPKSEDEER